MGYLDDALLDVRSEREKLEAENAALEAALFAPVQAPVEPVETTPRVKSWEELYASHPDWYKYATLEQANAAEQSQYQQDLANARPVMPGFWGQAGAGIEAGRTAFASPFIRFGSNFTDALGNADDLQRDTQATMLAAQQAGDDWWSRAIRNIASSTTQMLGNVALGAVAGPAGIPLKASLPALSGIQAMDQAVTEGRDAGLQGGQLAAYAGLSGAIEAGVTYGFNKLGIGGQEEMLDELVKNVTRPARQYVGQYAWNFGKQLAAENLEELIINVGQQVLNHASGVQQFGNAEQFALGLRDTVVATTAMMLPTGGLGAVQPVQRSLRAREVGQQIAQGRQLAAEQQAQFQQPWLGDRPPEGIPLVDLEGMSEGQIRSLAGLEATPSRKQFASATGMDPTPNATGRLEYWKAAKEWVQQNPAPEPVEQPAEPDRFQLSNQPEPPGPWQPPPTEPKYQPQLIQTSGLAGQQDLFEPKESAAEPITQPEAPGGPRTRSDQNPTIESSKATSVGPGATGNVATAEPPLPAPAGGAEQAPGSPEKTKVYRVWQGRGASLEKVYAPELIEAGVAGPILGPGQYYAFDKETAGHYGNVTEHDIAPKRTLVINSDDQWRKIVNASGAYYLTSFSEAIYSKKQPKLITEARENLRRYIESFGYDSVLVRLDKNSDSTRRLGEAFGHDQLIVFGKQVERPKVDAPVSAPEPAKAPEKKPDYFRRGNVVNRTVEQVAKRYRADPVAFKKFYQQEFESYSQRYAAGQEKIDPSQHSMEGSELRADLVSKAFDRYVREDGRIMTSKAEQSVLDDVSFRYGLQPRELLYKALDVADVHEMGNVRARQEGTQTTARRPAFRTVVQKAAWDMLGITKIPGLLKIPRLGAVEKALTAELPADSPIRQSKDGLKTLFMAFVDRYQVARDAWQQDGPIRELRQKLRRHFVNRGKHGEAFSGGDYTSIPSYDHWPDLFRAVGGMPEAFGHTENSSQTDKLLAMDRFWEAVRSYKGLDPDTVEGRTEVVQQAIAAADDATQPQAREPGDDEFEDDTDSSWGSESDSEYDDAVPFDRVVESRLGAKKSRQALPRRVEQAVPRGTDVRPITKRAVRVALQEATNALAGREVPLRVRISNTFSRGTQGYYRPMQMQFGNVMRERLYGSFGTQMHESGHALFDNLKFMREWWKNAQSTSLGKDAIELRDLSFPMYPTIPSGFAGKGLWFRMNEGFAEFWRLYLSAPTEAKRYAPTFFAKFDAAMQADPKQRQQIERARDAVNRWYDQSSVNRTVGSTVDPWSFKERLQDWKAAVQRVLLPSMWYDARWPVINFAREAVRRGAKLSPSENPETLIKATTNLSGPRIEYFLNNGTLDGMGNPTGGRPLADIIEPIKGKTSAQEFGALMLARWKIALDDVGDEREVAITRADADQTVRDLGTPELIQAADDVLEWLWATQDYAADLDPDGFGSQLARFRAPGLDKADPRLRIPLGRDFDPLWDKLELFHQEIYRKGPGSVQTGQLVRRFRGSGRPVMDVLTQIINEGARMIDMGHKRMIINSVVKAAEKSGLGMGDLLEPISPSKIPAHKDHVGELMKRINKVVTGQFGADTYFDLANREHLTDKQIGFINSQLVTFFKLDVTDEQKRELWAYNDGQKLTYFAVNPGLRMAMDAMNPLQTSGLLSWLAVPTRLVEMGAVGIKPSFNLAKNIFVDFPSLYGALQTKRNLPSLAASYVKSIAEAATYAAGGPKSPWVDLYLRAGLSQAKLVATRSPTARNWIQKQFRVWNWQRPLEWFEKWNELIQSTEAGGRLTALKAKMKDFGVDVGAGQQPSFDQMLTAMVAAKEALGDHAGKGHWTKWIAHYVPFFTTPLTYGRTFAQGVARNPRKAAMMLLSLGAAATAYWWSIKDEEWWKSMPQDQKWRNLYFPAGDGEMFTYPLDTHPLMSSIATPMAILDALYEQDPKAVKGLFGEMFRQFVPMGKELQQFPQGAAAGVLAMFGANPILKAGIEAGTDRKTDRPGETINPRGMENVYAGQKYTPQTGLGARALGSAIGVSPAMIDRTASTLTGGASQGLESVAKYGVAKAQGREPASSDFPIFGARMRRGGDVGTNPEQTQEFYTRKEAIDLKDRFTDDTPERLEMRRMFADAAEAMTHIRKRRDRDDTSPKERQRLQSRINDIAKAVIAQQDTGKVDRETFQAMRYAEEYRTATPAEQPKLLLNRMEALSRARPTRVKAIDDWKADQKVSRMFLEEAGISKKEASQQAERLMIRAWQDRHREQPFKSAESMLQSQQDLSWKIQRLRAALR